MEQDESNIDNRTVKVTDKKWTAGNIVSMGRALIGFVIVYIHMFHGGVTFLFGFLVAVGIISDYVDGWLARIRNEVSELGKVLDPVADKIMATVLFTYAVILGLIPLWFLILALLRDALILMGSVYIRKKHGKVAMSVMSGKVFVNILALYWIAVVFFPEYQEAGVWLKWITVTFMAGSFLDYVNRFGLILSGKKFN